MKRLFLLASAAGILLSCENGLFISGEITDGGMTFNVKKTKGYATRSASEPEKYISVADGMTIETEVYDIDEILDGPSTKGLVLTTTNLRDPAQGFILDGWLGDEIDSAPYAIDSDKNDHHFMKGESVHYDSATNLWPTTQYWRRGIKHYFWAYAPTSASVSLSPSADYSSATFSYTSDGAEDLLIAKANHQYPEEETSAEFITPLVFSHTLAAVKFEVGDIIITADNPLTTGMDETEYDNGTTKLVNITSPLISGAKNTGTCSFNGTTVSWNGLGGSSDITVSGVSRENFDTAMSGEHAIFLIPQTFSIADTAAQRVSFKFTRDNIGYTKNTPLNKILPSGILAGKYYRCLVNSTVSGNVLTDIVPEMHPSGDVKIEDGVLKFSGSGNDGGYASFPGFDFSATSGKIQIEFDIEVGNDAKGIVYAKFGERNMTLTQSSFFGTGITTTDVMDTNKVFFVTVPTKGTKLKAINPSGSFGSSTSSGSIERYHTTATCDLRADFDLTDAQLRDLEVSFGYNGGNGGNAHWWVSNFRITVIPSGV